MAASSSFDIRNYIPGALAALAVGVAGLFYTWICQDVYWEVTNIGPYGTGQWASILSVRNDSLVNLGKVTIDVNIMAPDGKIRVSGKHWDEKNKGKPDVLIQADSCLSVEASESRNGWNRVTVETEDAGLAAQCTMRIVVIGVARGAGAVQLNDRSVTAGGSRPLARVTERNLLQRISGSMWLWLILATLAILGHAAWAQREVTRLRKDLQDKADEADVRGNAGVAEDVLDRSTKRLEARPTKPASVPHKTAPEKPDPSL